MAISSNLVEHRAKIAEIDRRRAEAERRRLFYVAVTRATDAVIVAMTKARTKEMKYKEVEADLLNTLFPGEADFPLTSGEFEYGGSEPATFTRIEVRKEEPAEGNADNTANAGDAPANTGGQATLDDASANADGQTALAEDSSSSNDNVSADKAQNILVPNLESKPVSQAKPIARRTNFFSYSAIAPHGAGLPAQVVVDPDNNGDENIASQPTYDADKATDFGSALHRTCEWIALQPTTPTENEVNQAALRFGGVYGILDIQRLLDGVNRWFRSSIAARSYAFASCQPEVPFCTVVAGGYLEGEIDLFCTNNDGHAFIVDYKTGGNDAETPEQLFDKHHLQAMCYAYTTLVSGFDSVELHFVRVERTDAADPSQPQVVSYDFAQKDLPNLEKTIFEAKRSAESDAQ